jgi:hypothetical protein
MLKRQAVSWRRAAEPPQGEKAIYHSGKAIPKYSPIRGRLFKNFAGEIIPRNCLFYLGSRDIVLRSRNVGTKTCCG